MRVKRKREPEKQRGRDVGRCGKKERRMDEERKRRERQRVRDGERKRRRKGKRGQE